MYTIDENGIRVPTLGEIISHKETRLKDIYGQNINLDSNTPDGQLINIEAQSEVDLGEVAVGIYNSFDPDNAYGRALDRNAGFRGIKRKGGTFTQLPLSLVISRPVNLPGLDSNYSDVNATGFTVADGNGNQFILVSSTPIAAAGTYSLLFRSQRLGDIQPQLNTVNNILTPLLGVDSANNTAAPTVVGTAEESDVALRIRFNQSTGLDGSGSWENIRANLLNLDTVTNVGGGQNRTGVTNAFGIPPHSIWAVIEGGDNDDIAQVIFDLLNAGCGMRGDIEVEVADAFGKTEPIYFDRPTVEQLYVRFNVSQKTPDAVIDEDYLKAQLVQNLTFTLYDTVDVNRVGCLMGSIDSNLLYTDTELSRDGVTWQSILTNTNLNYIFSLSVDNIGITVL